MKLTIYFDKKGKKKEFIFLMYRFSLRASVLEMNKYFFFFLISYTLNVTTPKNKIYIKILPLLQRVPKGT